MCILYTFQTFRYISLLLNIKHGMTILLFCIVGIYRHYRTRILWINRTGEDNHLLTWPCPTYVVRRFFVHENYYYWFYRRSDGLYSFCWIPSEVYIYIYTIMKSIFFPEKKTNETNTLRRKYDRQKIKIKRRWYIIAYR